MWFAPFEKKGTRMITVGRLLSVHCHALQIHSSVAKHDGWRYRVINICNNNNNFRNIGLIWKFQHIHPPVAVVCQAPVDSIRCSPAGCIPCSTAYCIPCPSLDCRHRLFRFRNSHPENPRYIMSYALAQLAVAIESRQAMAKCNIYWWPSGIYSIYFCLLWAWHNFSEFFCAKTSLRYLISTTLLKKCSGIFTSMINHHKTRQTVFQWGHFPITVEAQLRSHYFWSAGP